MSNPLIYNDPSGEFISIFFSGLGKTSTGAVIGGAIGTVAGAAIGATLGLAGALGGGFIGGQLGSAIGNYIGGGNPIGKDDLPLNDSLNYTPSNHVTLDSILNSNTNNENSCG